MNWSIQNTLTWRPQPMFLAWLVWLEIWLMTLAHGSSAHKTDLSSQQLQGVQHNALPPGGGRRGDSPGCVPLWPAARTPLQGCWSPPFFVASVEHFMHIHGFSTTGSRLAHYSAFPGLSVRLSSQQNLPPPLPSSPETPHSFPNVFPPILKSLQSFHHLKETY